MGAPKRDLNMRSELVALGQFSFRSNTGADNEISGIMKGVREGQFHIVSMRPVLVCFEVFAAKV